MYVAHAALQVLHDSYVIHRLSLITMLWAWYILCCSLPGARAAAQAALGASNMFFMNTTSDGNRGTSYDDGLVTPLESLSLLSSNEFSTLKHPLYPRHSVRIKKSQFCDGTVGYVYPPDFLTIAHVTIARTLATSILKLGICSSISLRVAVTPIRTT